MRARALTPAQWRSQSKADRLDMLAFDYRRDQRRWSLFDEAAKLGEGWGGLAQILIWLSDIDG